tara:strand:+ start:134 stop:667 length:534 start_codon:yes stop_codon:yes gene_type:complete
MNSKSLNNISIAIILVLLASITRLIPHLWNFTAVGAVLLFSTFYFKNRTFRLLIPIAIMLFSDLCLYLIKGIPFAGIGIYLCLMLYIPISIRIIKKVKIMSVALAGISGATLFFMTSNFLVWIQGGGYGLGFIETYLVAIPFYLNHMMGNMLWGTLLFGIYEAALKPTKDLTLITKD